MKVYVVIENSILETEGIFQVRGVFKNLENADKQLQKEIEEIKNDYNITSIEQLNNYSYLLEVERDDIPWFELYIEQHDLK